MEEQKQNVAEQEPKQEEHKEKPQQHKEKPQQHKEKPQQHKEKQPQHKEKQQQDQDQEQPPQDKPKEIYKKKEKKDEKFDWDRTKVTLETKIPDQPKGAQVVKKPDEEAFRKKISELDKKIDQLFEKKNELISDLISKSKSQANTKYKGEQPLKERLKRLHGEKKQQYQKLDEVKEEIEKNSSQINALFEETQQQRKKMKKLFNKDDIEKQIAFLQDKLNNAYMSPSEEKNTIKEIEELKKTIPLTIPLVEVEKKIAQLKDDQKKQYSEKSVIITALKALDSEIGDLQLQLDDIRADDDVKRKEIDPVIEKYKAEFKEKIDKLRDERKASMKDYHHQLDEYYDQQDLLRYIGWLKRIKSKLEREQRIKQKEDLRKKQEEEEKKADEENNKGNEDESPYQKDIENCELLISYCVSLKPQEVQKEVKLEDKMEIIKKGLESQEWKKEKVDVIISKRDQPEDQFLGGKKSKKFQQKQKKESTEPKEVQIQPLNHAAQVLSMFSAVNCMPPKNVTELDKCIQLLKEKKEYFEKLPKPEKKLNDKEQIESDEEEIKNIEQQKDRMKQERERREEDLDFSNQEKFPGLQN